MIHYLVAGIIDLIFGAIALSKKRDNLAKAFALTTICAAGWSFELFLLSYMTDRYWLELLFPILRTGMFLIPPSVALFTWLLIGGQSRWFFKWVILPGFAAGLMLGVLNTSVYPTELRAVANGYLPEVDGIFYGFIAVFLACFIPSIALCSQHYPKATLREKQKIRWLLATLLFTFLFACLAIYLMAFDFYLSKLVGVLPNLVFVSLLLYATLQHHLMDIRAILSSGMARILLTCLFSAGYFGLITLGPAETSVTHALIAILLFAATLEAYPRVLAWALPNTRRLLAASNYDFEREVQRMRPKFNHCQSKEALVALLDHLFYHVIKVRHYQLFVAQNDGSGAFSSLNQPGKHFMLCDQNGLAQIAGANTMVMADETGAELKSELEHHAAISLFPIKVDNKIVAVVLVGQSLTSAMPYRHDDIRLMEWMVGEISQTLSRILQLDKLHKELAQAKKNLSLLGLMNLYHHDIKAPLSIIDGVVSNDLYDEDRRREVILEQVAWGSHLITTMARLLKGDRSIQVGPVDLSLLIQDCCQVFGHSIRNLHTDIASTPTIQGDAEDLKIMFINVLKNAYEAASPERILEVHLRTWTCQHWVNISIADNGIGMNEVQLANLWVKNTSTKSGGSGIGLQTIKHIADEHNAEILVASKPGSGSCFHFRFPLNP